MINRLYQRINGIHPGLKLISTIIAALISIATVLLIGIGIAIPIWGLDNVVNSFGQASSSANIDILKYFQILQSTALFIIPAFIIGYMDTGKPIKFLNLNRSSKWHSYIVVLLIMFIAIPLINVLGIWNANIDLPAWLDKVEYWMLQMEQDAEVLTSQFLEMNTPWDLAFNLFMIAIIPAIGEELIFRGVVQKYLIHWTKNIHIGIWISAFVFSAFHMQFYGFFPRMILGVMFGYLLIYSSSIWLPVFAHFINNAVAVIAYFFYGNKILESDPNEFGIQMSTWILFVNAVIIFALFRVIYFSEKKDT